MICGDLWWFDGCWMDGESVKVIGMNFRIGIGWAGGSAAVCLLLSGCHSHYVDATVHNGTGGPATVVEVDYPSASFGKELLPDGADFRYRFKILGSGPTKVLWTDAGHQDHSVAGPRLEEGQEGRLVVTLTPSGATWDAKLTAR